MKTLKHLITTSLSLLAFLPLAAAQGRPDSTHGGAPGGQTRASPTAEEVADRYLGAIRAEEQSAFANLATVFEAGGSRLLAMAANGASDRELLQAGTEIVASMRDQANRSASALKALRERGVAELEQMNATPRLVTLVQDAAAAAIRSVDQRTNDLARAVGELLNRLL